ncbi:hypothetical protein Tco_0155099 [Tanacetum coccineum]
MLVQGPIQQGKGSTVPVESHHTPITTPSTLQPPFSSPSKVPIPPYDSPLPGGHTPGKDEQTKKVYGNAYTKLIMRVKKLEHRVKTRQPTRRARVVISDTEEELEDPSKQGRRIAEINQNPSISLVQDEGTSNGSIGFYRNRMEDIGSGKKGEKEISTANISVSTASVIPEVSTAAANLVYIRRSAEKRKDKGKAIMKEDESVQKKAKKQLEQEILGHEEAIRLQEHINEEEKQRIARDAKIAKQYHALQNRSFSIAEVRKNMCMYLKNQKGYKQSHFKGMSYEDIRPIYKRVWDENNDFVPKDYEIKNEMLDDFDRQDVLDLHRLVQERISIHMMIEKKYPLTQEMLSRMLSRRLEVDQESKMAFELLRFTRSQLQK